MNAVLAINRRPGKLWAVLQFPLVRFILGVSAVLAWLIATGVLLHVLGVHGRSPLGAALSLLLAAGVLAVYVGYVRLLERRPLAELAPRDAVKFSARGILTGAGLF